MGTDLKVRPYMRRRRQFFTDNNGVAGALDAPAGDRVKCGRTHGVAGLETETGVMPRASNRPVDNDAV